MSNVFVIDQWGRAKYPPSGRSRAIRVAPKLLIVGVVCYLSTEIGFAHKIPPHNISALWPTNAILFAVLVVAPARDWWAYAVAAYFTSVHP